MSSAAGVQTVAAAPETQSSLPAVDFETIAHELRQPLSAIESIAYYLSLALPRDSGPAREQAGRLQQLVEQSNWILTSALQLADCCAAGPATGESGRADYPDCHARAAESDSSIRLELAGGLPLVRLDPGRGRALLENLLHLFRQLASDLHPVRVTTASRVKAEFSRSSSARCRVIVRKLSLGPGCGLSIQSARRVVEGHGGTFNIHVDAVSGVSLKVVLP